LSRSQHKQNAPSSLAGETGEATISKIIEGTPHSLGSAFKKENDADAPPLPGPTEQT
jgi:hypothetical protein